MEQREAFVLYEESGMSLDDIGRITGVAMETAKSRLRYAVGKLRECTAAPSNRRAGVNASEDPFEDSRAGTPIVAAISRAAIG